LACLWLNAGAADLDYLRQLLAATPSGGWVKASTNKYSDAWVTGAAATPPTPSGPDGIVRAWSSTAWDSTNGNLLLWGGGHANYAGNEMYVWNGSDGTWGRGSLASRVEPLGAGVGNYVVDNAAPQSAHTLDTNIYLPINKMFLTLGGASYNTGSNFETNENGVPKRAGPWLWDPSKADPNKAGGTSGSGWDPASPGGNMWINRADSFTGSQPPRYEYGTTAYRAENGHDVVYVSSDLYASGRPPLYRYTLGDVRNGGSDTWEMIGVMWDTVAYQGTAAIDLRNNLFVRTATSGGDLAIWDLSKSNAADPSANRAVGVNLVTSTGDPFIMNGDMAVSFDEASGQLVMWDGRDRGTVWSTHATFEASGSLASTWVIDRLVSTTDQQPSGNFVTGVLGKWDYVAELGAFVALNEYDAASKDAEVWFYKPIVAAVPELGSLLMMATGLVVLVPLAWRRRDWRGALTSPPFTDRDRSRSSMAAVPTDSADAAPLHPRAVDLLKWMRRLLIPIG